MTDDKTARTLPAWAVLGSPRRKALVGVILLAALLIAGASSWSQIQPVGAKAASDIIRLLEGRSPGERGEANLSKVKQSRNLARAIPEAPGGPQERVLGKIFPAETGIATPEEMLLAQFPELPIGEGAAELAELPQLASLGGPGVGGITGMPVFIGGGGGPGGAGGGGDPGGGDPTIPPGVITPPPAVPEPGTWLLMLLGSFLCAAALRRHRRPRRGEGVLQCARGS